jgi:hypothetical protein
MIIVLFSRKSKNRNIESNFLFRQGYILDLSLSRIMSGNRKLCKFCAISFHRLRNHLHSKRRSRWHPSFHRNLTLYWLCEKRQVPKIRSQFVLKHRPDNVKDDASKSLAGTQDSFQKVQQVYELLSDDKNRAIRVR